MVVDWRERYLALDGGDQEFGKIASKGKTYRSTVSSTFDEDGVPSPQLLGGGQTP